MKGMIECFPGLDVESYATEFSDESIVIIFLVISHSSLGTVIISFAISFKNKRQFCSYMSTKTIIKLLDVPNTQHYIIVNLITIL